MGRILLGVRPACLGMVFGVLVSLLKSTYFPETAVNLPGLIIGLVDLVLLLKYKVSIPKVLIFSAAMGLILFGLVGL